MKIFIKITENLNLIKVKVYKVHISCKVYTSS